MRKSTAVLAALSLSAVALTGCTATASFNGAVCARDAGASDIANLATISGDLGEAPTVEAFTPLASDAVEYSDVITGTGPTLETERQLAVMDITLLSGETGDPIVATDYSGDLSRVNNLASLGTSLPGIAEAMACATEGSRVFALIPNDQIDPNAAAQWGITNPDGATMAVVDVLSVLSPGARGALQFNDAGGLPTVVRAADGQPGVLIPDADAPTELVTETLIAGDGDVVTAEAGEVWIDMVAVNWDTRAATQNTWDANPMGASQLASTPEVAAALLDKTVGSELMVVVPGADGGAATVYVIDILGITPAATQPTQ